MKIHLIANAHLDPMWLWEWEDGCASAISTFRTAAEFCEKYDALVFNHNEALLYDWVRKYEPQLFSRIQDLVKRGKWVISGGWYLQPDCNMPSGESIVRQITAGNLFFEKYFGKLPQTAMNLDSFGHSRGLVPILNDAGYKAYFICRPRDEHHDMPLPERFIWRGKDGSEIPVFRDSATYGTGPDGTAHKIESVIKEGKQKDFENVLVMWGIGDHGGGISKKDYEELEKFIASGKYEIVQTSFDDYAKAFIAENNKLPVIEETLGSSMTGCYTSQIGIKKKHRNLENLYYTVEQMAASLYAQGRMEYPAETLEKALHDLLLIEFHDALPGSSVRGVEESAMRIADHAAEELINLRMQCFYKLCEGQPKSPHKVYPIMVYNPHPYDIEELVTCEYTMAEQNWEPCWTEGEMTCEGAPVPCQWEQQAGNMMIDWQKRVTFRAKLKAGQITRFDITEKRIPARKEKYAITQGEYFEFNSKDFAVEFNKKTGYIEKIAAGGETIFAGEAFGTFEAVATSKDPWGTFENEYPQKGERFRLAEKSYVNNMIKSSFDNENVRVIEDGEVRTVIEAIYVCGDSRIVARYAFPKEGKFFDLSLDVYWLESDTLLKLALPLGNGEVCGQTMFSRETIPHDGRETAFGKYLLWQSGNKRLAVINDCVHGCDYKNGNLRMSLLRSASYSGSKVYELPLTREDAYVDRIDNGLRSYKFRFVFGGEEVDYNIDRQAETFARAPFALCFFPSGEGQKPKAAIKVSGNAICSAIKKQDSGRGIAVRVYNPADSRSEGEIFYFGKPVAKYKLEPHRFATFIINKAGKAVEVKLTEKSR